MSVAYCPHCGSDIEYISTNDEFYNIRRHLNSPNEILPEYVSGLGQNPFDYPDKQTGYCPLCGGIAHSRLHYPKNDYEDLWVYYYWDEQGERHSYTTETDGFPEAFKELEWSACDTVAEEFVSKLKTGVTTPPSDIKNSIDIGQYLNALLNIETDILFYTDQLKFLLFTQKDIDRRVLKEKLLLQREATMPIFQELIKTIDIKGSLKCELLSLDITPEEYGLTEPEKPTVWDEGIVDLFRNRKYNKILSEYNSNWERIKQQETERRKAENEKRKYKYQKELDRLETIIASLKEQTESVKVDTSSSDSGVCKANRICLEEIDNTKEMLKELCKARNQLINIGIIHPKYLTFIAISSMAEYFETGRCTSLEGPDGAYNMYEAEIRADRIISQLDKVITSLETIKETQYKAYNALRMINYNIDSFCNQFTEVIDKLENISQETRNISQEVKDNAITNAINSYHTAQIAFNTSTLHHISAATSLLYCK